MLVPREEEAIHRGLGLLTSIVTFAVSLSILTGFDAGQAGFQMEVDRLWIAPLGIRFQQAAGGTQQVSNNINGVSDAVEESGTAAGEVRTAADQLAEQAGTLRDEVDQFLSTVRAA